MLLTSLVFLIRLAIEVLGNSTQDLCDLAAGLALRVTALSQHWLDLGLQESHNIREHAG